MARPASFSRALDNRCGRLPWPAPRNTAPGPAIRPACDRHLARNPGRTAASESAPPPRPPPRPPPAPPAPPAPRGRRGGRSSVWEAAASRVVAHSAARPPARLKERSNPTGARSVLARSCRWCRLARPDPVREPRADAFQTINEQPRGAGAGEAVERARIAHEFRRNATLAQGHEELLGIGDRYTLVVFGMHDQHRRVHVVHIRHRRQHAIERIALPGRAAELILGKPLSVRRAIPGI